MATKHAYPKEGETFTLPIDLPARVEGKHGNVEFTGKGTIHITTDKITFIDEKTGPLVDLIVDRDVVGWMRLVKPGRLAKRTGVEVAWLKEGPGLGFFELSDDARKVFEFALNKHMGWTLEKEDDLIGLLTASSESLGWPKEQLEKVAPREHFFANRANIARLARYARGRMQHDPATELPHLSDGNAPEAMWVIRYSQYMTRIERFVTKHPDLANLFPYWTADTLATESVKLMQSIDYQTPVQKATTQIKPVLLDIAGNVIGIGESLRILGGNAIVFSPEDAQQFLQNIRTSDIDSTDWVTHKGGIDYLNKRIEFAELLLAGRADEAPDMMVSMQQAYSIYLKSKAENTGVDFLALWWEKQGILTAYTILLMYVAESVKRGVWKPVVMSPLRVSAPSTA
jgi:hypothetical protein